MRSTRSKVIATSAALVVSAAVSTASAKDMSIVVGFAAGGMSHTVAMLLSRHIGAYLPDKPIITVRTMPGAGSVLAANYLANVAPKDGSTLAVLGGGIVLEPIFGNTQAKYDPRSFAWIGSTSSEVYTCVTWADSKITSLEEAKSRVLPAGTTGRGSRTHSYASALNELVGTKFKIIGGYRGLGDVQLAMEQRELDAVCGWGYNSILSQKPEWLPEKKINILVQFGFEKHPSIPDVPLIFDFLSTDDQRDAMKMLIVDTLVAWPLVGPPGLSQENVSRFRSAYQAVVQDPALLKEADQLKVAIAPVPGAELQKAVNDLATMPPQVIELARRLSGM